MYLWFGGQWTDSYQVPDHHVLVCIPAGGGREERVAV